MDVFSYKDNILYCEDVNLMELAEKIGTPFYCYSLSYIEKRFMDYKRGFGDSTHLICYAVKANSNLSVLKFLATLGAGADIVSGGELFRCLKAGISPSRIVYSGVGKTKEEIVYALKEGILMFNVESLEELSLISKISRELGKKAPVSFRVNPDVDPKTHPYISTGLKKNKFGLSIQQAIEAYERASYDDFIEIRGIDCHIGSQITEVGPFLDAIGRVRELLKRLKEKGIVPQYFDIGGGLGITYKNENPPTPFEFIQEILKEVKDIEQTIIIEPGRSLVGNSGALLTKILYFKENSQKAFYIVDAGMNDLGRPSLYDAYHEILPVQRPKDDIRIKVDVVGPICETGDFLARERELPRLYSGDLLAVMNSGAYGFTMSSNYNSRPRVPEVVVKGDRFFIARRRETFKDLVSPEDIPQWMEVRF